jgi:hypothetical protein
LIKIKIVRGRSSQHAGHWPLLDLYQQGSAVLMLVGERLQIAVSPDALAKERSS